MRSWRSPRDGRLLAEEEAGGAVRLRFGQHRGKLLAEAPAAYVAWIADGGQGAVPADLQGVAGQVLLARLPEGQRQAVIAAIRRGQRVAAEAVGRAVAEHEARTAGEVRPPRRGEPGWWAWADGTGGA